MTDPMAFATSIVNDIIDAIDYSIQIKPNVVSRVATFDGYFTPLGFTDMSDGKLKLWSLYGMGCKIVKQLTGYVLKCQRPPSRTLNYV